MPQLMPLMWMLSVIMSMLIFLVYMDMYFYKFGYEIEIMKDSHSNGDKMSFLW